MSCLMQLRGYVYTQNPAGLITSTYHFQQMWYVHYYTTITYTPTLSMLYRYTQSTQEPYIRKDYTCTLCFYLYCICCNVVLVDRKGVFLHSTRKDRATLKQQTLMLLQFILFCVVLYYILCGCYYAVRVVHMHCMQERYTSWKDDMQQIYPTTKHVSQRL